MAPIAISSSSNESYHAIDQIKAALSQIKLNNSAPQLPADKFDFSQYSHFDATPSIGTEFRAYSPDGKPVLNIRDVLGNDARLKAGRLVSERGVVFFRDAVMSAEEQKDLIEALGRAGGRPESSGLHVHPLTLGGSELGDEISVISNKFVFDKAFGRDWHILQRAVGKSLWASQSHKGIRSQLTLTAHNVSFENVPSDYACLQIRTFPENGGGDTLWASSYEAYDRLSPPMQQLLEGMTATHTGEKFVELARLRGEPLRENRGSPENVGQDLVARHPIIRTNPVTGWKGLFVNGEFTKRINEVTQGESDALLAFLFEHVTAGSFVPRLRDIMLTSQNHDLQVRFRWEPNSLAIWDNRSTLHAATHDIDGDLREGTRSVSLGERPYLDPASKSRRAALAEAKAKA